MQAALHTSPIHIVPRAHVARHASAQPAAKCSVCHLKDLCLPRGLASVEVQRLDGLEIGRRRVRQGEPLYLAGEKFGFVFAVRAGTFKSTLMLPDGREQVSGFHMAAEVMGMDGLALGKHASAAEALEDAEVCVIPYAQLSEFAAGYSRLQHIIGRLMSREITRERRLMTLLGSMNAEERLAAFLSNLSERMSDRGYSPAEFHLRMDRAEIGSYLGMKLETVSRTFTIFQRRGILSVDKKHIRILDLERLTSSSESRVH